MSGLFLQYLAIYSNEHLPNTKYALQNLSKTLIFVKVANFRLIWSHCQKGAQKWY